MGTPDFALPTLRALHAAPEIDLIAVITRPDQPAGRGKKLQAPPVKILAESMETEIFQPASLKKEEVTTWLRDRKPDVIVVVAYGGFVPTPVREIPPLGCVNLHPSLLPTYRGAAPMQWAIMNGDAVTGNSTMYLSDGWDDGDIIYQEEEPILPDEPYGSLSQRLSQKGGALIVRTLIDIAAGRAPRIPQDESGVVFAPMIKNEDCQIDWKRPAFAIHNQVRGLHPSPGAFTNFEGKRWKILRTKVMEGVSDLPGRVLSTEFNTIQVSTGDNILEILEMQPEGKKPMSAASFLRGYPICAGASFDSL